MEKYKTFGRRFGAAILDSLILIPVNWLFSIVFVFIDFALNKAISPILVGSISVFYYILMHFYFGQTLGKMLVKVKVLTDSETPINFGQAILRSLPQLLPVMFAVSFSTADQSAKDSITLWVSVIYGLTGLFFITDVIVCLSNAKFRALHDFIAGTVVVRTDV